MVEIVFNDNITSIKTSDLQIYVEGSLEIKKEGAEAPIIKVIANSQQEFEQEKGQPKNV